MKKLILALGSAALATLTACGDDTVVPITTDASPDHTVSFEASTEDSGDESDAGPVEEAGEAGPTLPAPPALGTQIDRMGRPAINTALNHAFDPACTATSCPPKDQYNANSSVSSWTSSYVPQFEQNLAVYDGLDTECGNQTAYGALGNPGYGTLATVLAVDMLWLDTANSSCQQYLAVELGALGLSNSDCGGRTLTENTIDFTYNAVAGTLTPASLPSNPGPVTNGITGPSSPPSTTFPYLASPH
jgi:hypothetical protein